MEMVLNPLEGSVGFGGVEWRRANFKWTSLHAYKGYTQKKI